MIASLILFAVAGLAGQGTVQATTPDAQVQRQILEELRAIRRDMRASSTLQLLLAELQITQTSLESANQNRDRLKARLAQVQVEKSGIQGALSQYEEGMSKVANPDQDFVDRLNQLKFDVKKAVDQEKSASDQLTEAEGRTRTAQSERDNVQTQLAELLKRLSGPN